MGRRNLGEDGHYIFLNTLYTAIEHITGQVPYFKILNYGRKGNTIVPENGQDYKTFRIEKRPYIQLGKMELKGYPVLGGTTGIAQGKLDFSKKDSVTFGHGYFQADSYPIFNNNEIAGWVYISNVTDLGNKWDPHCTLYLDDKKRNLPSILMSNDTFASGMASNLEEVALHSFMDSGEVNSAPLIVEYKSQFGNDNCDVLTAHADSIPVPYDTDIKGIFAVLDNGTGVEVLLRVLQKFANKPQVYDKSKALYWVFTFDEETTRAQSRHAIEQIEQLSTIEHVINVDTISQEGNLAVRIKNQDGRFKSLRRMLLGDARVFPLPKHTNSDIEFAAESGYPCFDFLTIGMDIKSINTANDNKLPCKDEYLERVAQFILQMRQISS